MAARGTRAALTMPVVGYLGIGSLEPNAPSMAGLRKGLNEQGFVEAQNVIIETRRLAKVIMTNC